MRSAVAEPSPLRSPVVTAVPHRSGRGLGRWTIFLLFIAGGAVAIATVTLANRSKAASGIVSALAPHVDGKRIVFSSEYAKRIGFETIEVRRKEVVPAFSLVGTVTFDPAYVAQIGARLRGVVRDVYRFEGAQVKAGAVLASIDSPELGEAQAAVTTLAAQNGAAQRHRLREESLAARQLTTTRDVEEAVAEAERADALLSAATQRVSALAGRPSDANGKGLGVHVLTSPLEGTIVERHVSRGQLVEANHMAFVVANLDHVWVDLSAFERSLPSIKVGDPVELHADARGKGEIVRGEVAQVGAVLNAETRGATIRVHVDNVGRKFRPGQSVNAVIRAAASAVDDVPTVPSSSVIYVDGEPSVFIADGPSSVIVTSVELGETNGQEVQIKDGVETGQRVVIHGTTELRNELFR